MQESPSGSILPTGRARGSTVLLGKEINPSHFHLEVEVRACHELLVVLVKALVLGHSEVVLPVSRDPWGQENNWGKSSHT